jgi:hypothetical protein
MNLKEILGKLADIQIDSGFVAQLKKMYKVDLPDEVKHIVSLSKDTVFYEDFSLLRGLSHAEISDASSDMAVDFIGKELLPLFDIGDNDYIVYDITEKVWCKFNIVDEVKFSKSKSISALL